MSDIVDILSSRAYEVGSTDAGLLLLAVDHIEFLQEYVLELEKSVISLEEKLAKLEGNLLR